MQNRKLEMKFKISLMKLNTGKKKKRKINLASRKYLKNKTFNIKNMEKESIELIKTKDNIVRDAAEKEKI